MHVRYSGNRVPKTRKPKTRFEDIPLSKAAEANIEILCQKVIKQINFNNFKQKTLPVETVLKLVGAGVFIAGAMIAPNLPRILSPFLKKIEENEANAWKRFNIPYLKRKIERLEKQRLISVSYTGSKQTIEITNAGRKRILKLALDELEIKKPKLWDQKWRLVSYDIPRQDNGAREFFRQYLHYWGFYPLHASVYLHAYPCENEIEFLREYLGIGEYVRIFQVSKLENDQLFRNYFDL